MPGWFKLLVLAFVTVVLVCTNFFNAHYWLEGFGWGGVVNSAVGLGVSLIVVSA